MVQVIVIMDAWGWVSQNRDWDISGRRAASWHERVISSRASSSCQFSWKVTSFTELLRTRMVSSRSKASTRPMWCSVTWSWPRRSALSLWALDSAPVTVILLSRAAPNAEHAVTPTKTKRNYKITNKAIMWGSVPSAIFLSEKEVLLGTRYSVKLQPLQSNIIVG